MNQKLISEIGKSQSLQIINQLKRTQGLAVSELANRLKMSYMGVKQHCIELSAKGYLDTMRRPKSIGRPEMVYRLTERAHELFPVASNPMTLALLDAAKTLFGISAPEKLLLIVFQKKEEQYRKKIRGDSPMDRMKSLAKLRDAEGCMADFESDENGTRIVEHHSPTADLLQTFPFVARLETEIFQRLLGTEIVRTESRVAGLYQCVFFALKLATQTSAKTEPLPEEAYVEPLSEPTAEPIEDFSAQHEPEETAALNEEKMAVSGEAFSPEIETDLESHKIVARTENSEFENIESFAEPLPEPALDESANHELSAPDFVERKTLQSPAEPFAEPILEELTDLETEQFRNEEIESSPLATAESEFPTAENLRDFSAEEKSDFVAPIANLEKRMTVSDEEILPEKNAAFESIQKPESAEIAATETPHSSEAPLPETQGAEPFRTKIRKLPQVKPKPLVRRSKASENQPDLFSL